MLKSYYYLTKPGIIYGNAINTAAGFFLASQGAYDFKLLMITIVGISLIVASACVFNNILDANIDAKMERTKNRAMVRGTVKKSYAITFGIVLLIFGITNLALSTNHLALYAALIGFFVYVFLYTFSKRYSVYGTEIGSVAGAMPPVVGYLSVSYEIDSGAIILFAIFVLWQMPHFYAIAIYRLKEYVAADIPILSAVKGVRRTKMNILAYILAFTVAVLLLKLLNYTGYVYLFVMSVLCLAWLVMAFRGFKAADDSKWARGMFKFSLLIVLTFCVIIPIDKFLT